MFSPESKRVWYFEHGRFDRLVSELLAGRVYSTLAGLGDRLKGNDTYELIDARELDHLREFCPWDGVSDNLTFEQAVGMWSNRESSPAPEVMLGRLIELGHLPPGEYLFDLMW